jgi:hypothetical protein
MLRIAKRFLWMLLLAFGLQGVLAFVPAGPIGNGGDAWQTPSIGYGLGGDLNAPKNIGEAYRRNIPVLYYSYDANFLDFFGSNGVAAVDSAFSLVNNAFTNNPSGLTNGLDGYSANLQEFPDNAQSLNFEAQALGLTDLKSSTMYLLMEQLGLADPDRYVWTLHDRLTTGPLCPLDVEYLVVQRNFDIANSPLNQIQYSSYINDVLYTYEIEEFCPPNTPLAVTFPFPVDPFAQVDQALASFGLNTGGFYTGLTRDDAEGLKYLLTTNNINTETSGTGSLLMNSGTTELLTSSNLSALVQSSQTNDPVTLAGLFPGLTVASSTNNFIAVCTPNVSVVFKNQTGAPVGSPQVSVLVTNGVNCVGQELFTTTFANVITNGNLTNNPGVVLSNPNIHFSYYTNTAAVLQTVLLGPKNGQPYPATIVTNVTSKNVTLTNVISGEYLILPPGQCGWQIISVLLTNVVRTTNVIASATNAAGAVSSETIITLFTNHTFVVSPITCTGTGTGLYEGIEKVQFVRADFDSLLGQTFQPITTDYTMTAITNSQAFIQRFQRTVTAPDVLSSAADLGTLLGSRNLNFSQANILPGLAGPGVINSPTTITLNKVGDIFENGTLADFDLTATSFLSELTQIPLVAWGSFDDSTNDPVVYPNGTSIANLQNQVLIQISPTSLPDAAAGAFYTQTFSATGGAFSQPFTWSAYGLSAIGAPTGLPAGLTMTTDANGNGLLSGTPTQSGTFDIVVQLTDSLGRSVTWNYTINII